jgi:hypothetical protein
MGESLLKYWRMHVFPNNKNESLKRFLRINLIVANYKIAMHYK